MKLRVSGADPAGQELDALIIPLARSETLPRGLRGLDAALGGAITRSLERGDFDGQELTFVGFSDGSGGASANLQVSLRRANRVLEAVKAASETADLSQVTLKSSGYGEAFPVACDDTAWGRRVNRRVEVWVR